MMSSKKFYDSWCQILLDYFGDKLALSSAVKDLSKHLISRSRSEKLSVGRDLEIIVAACIYAACRMRNVPLTLEKIADTSFVSRKLIARTYRLIKRTLELDIPPFKPVIFVPAFCRELKLSSSTESRAIDILREAKERGLDWNVSFRGVVGGAIYIAAHLEGERRTQKAIADVLGLAEVTIRKRYIELVDTLNIIIEPFKG